MLKTEFERQVYHFTALGFTAAEIGAQLYLCERTVKSIKRDVVRRLGVPNTVAAVAALIREGQI